MKITVLCLSKVLFSIYTFYCLPVTISPNFFSDIKRKTDKKFNEKKSNRNYNLLQSNSKSFFPQTISMKKKNSKSKKQKIRKLQQSVKPLIFYKLLSRKEATPVDEPFVNVEGILR